jgi:hypothetical protein
LKTEGQNKSYYRIKLSFASNVSRSLLLFNFLKERNIPAVEFGRFIVSRVLPEIKYDKKKIGGKENIIWDFLLDNNFLAPEIKEGLNNNLQEKDVIRNVNDKIITDLKEYITVCNVEVLDNDTIIDNTNIRCLN